MARLNNYMAFLIMVILLAGCTSRKKPSLSGEDKVEYSDFVAFFPVRKLPYQFEDTSLLRKDNDSLLISYHVFTQFVPDSVMNALFGKGVKPRLYPQARVEKDETYFFLKGVAGSKHQVFVAAFDKKKKFVAAMSLLQVDQLSATRQTAGIDTKLALFKAITRKNGNGSISEGKDVYVLNNDAHNFMLIMTDALDDKATELINPIDTFPRKQKYSADYGSGKNLVSIRDAKKGGRFNFFIHFEKRGEECTGELKGVASMRTATQAEYHEAGEPCGLQFTFSNSGVQVKELGGCGSSRGLRCSFDGYYPRKKEPKAAKAKPRKSV